MLNVLYPQINWEKVTHVGFDLDGTLYDEFDFIKQVYFEIFSSLIKNKILRDKAYEYALQRWLEKGSSYNKIFLEVFQLFIFNEIIIDSDSFIKNALDIFRRFKPSLSLSDRNMIILSFIKQKYSIFLVSDGNYNLQKKKFYALGLSKFFKNKERVFTNQYDLHKPDAKILNYLNIDFCQSNLVFFGDRIVDKEFSSKMNANFVKVYNMIMQE